MELELPSAVLYAPRDRESKPVRALAPRVWSEEHRAYSGVRHLSAAPCLTLPPPITLYAVVPPGLPKVLSHPETSVQQEREPGAALVCGVFRLDREYCERG